MLSTMVFRAAREILLDFLLLRRRSHYLRIIRAVLIERFGILIQSRSDLRFSRLEITSLLRAAGSASTFPEIAMR